MAASKQARMLTQFRNAAPLVWGSLRLTAISMSQTCLYNISYQKATKFRDILISSTCTHRSAFFRGDGQWCLVAGIGTIQRLLTIGDLLKMY